MVERRLDPGAAPRMSGPMPEESLLKPRHMYKDTCKWQENVSQESTNDET